MCTRTVIGALVTTKTGSFYTIARSFGSGTTLRLVERFTRQSSDDLRYTFTVDDPATFTRPFTAVIPMRRCSNNGGSGTRTGRRRGRPPLTFKSKELSMHSHVTRRHSLVAWAIIAGLGLASVATAQIERVADPNWTVPRLPDGQPDLQGMWGNKTITPMERPESAGGRAFLSAEEIAVLNQQTAERKERLNAPSDVRDAPLPAGGNVGGYNNHWLDAGDTVLSTGQTSLIVDPPDGRAPVRPWALAAKAYNLERNGDHYQHMSVWDRCLSRGVPGSMLPAGYNNAYRIAQTPDHVAIQHEMIHDVRIIPLSDRPHIDPRIEQWMGDSRARWEGDTLVVESRNFTNRGWIASSGAGARLKGIPTTTRLHVVERFQRVSEETILWTVTIDDPNVYTEPWTISMPLTQDPTYEIYEYACHEGNWAVRNALSGQRAVDSRGETTEEQ